MSTPNFDALFAESDEATRAVVWPVEATDATPHRTSTEVRDAGLLGGAL